MSSLWCLKNIREIASTHAITLNCESIRPSKMSFQLQREQRAEGSHCHQTSRELRACQSVQFICTLCHDKTVFDSINILRSYMENDHDIKQIPKPKSRKTGGKWIGDLTSNPMKTVQEIVNKIRAEQKQEDQDCMLMDE